MTGQETMEVVVMLLCFVLAALASGTETALTSVGRSCFSRSCSRPISPPVAP